MEKKRLTKKPPLKKFKSILEKTGGNLTNAAKALEVTRKTIWDWSNRDPLFAEAIEECRMKMFDKCLATAQAVSLGIPDYQIGDDGLPHLVGWIERPDSGMLRYMISTLGRKEGWGESVDITSNGETIKPIKVVVIDNKEELEKLKKEDDRRKEWE